jgi:hypothetical protein
VQQFIQKLDRSFILIILSILFIKEKIGSKRKATEKA